MKEPCTVGITLARDKNGRVGILLNVDVQEPYAARQVCRLSVVQARALAHDLLAAVGADDFVHTLPGAAQAQACAFASF